MPLSKQVKGGKNEEETSTLGAVLCRRATLQRANWPIVGQMRRVPLGLLEAREARLIIFAHRVSQFSGGNIREQLITLPAPTFATSKAANGRGPVRCAVASDAFDAWLNWYLQIGHCHRNTAPHTVHQLRRTERSARAFNPVCATAP